MTGQSQGRLRSTSTPPAGWSHERARIPATGRIGGLQRRHARLRQHDEDTGAGLAYAITANCVAPGEISAPMTGQEDQDPHLKGRLATCL